MSLYDLHGVSCCAVFLLQPGAFNFGGAAGQGGAFNFQG
jgi:hypothetical protein